MMAEVKHSLVVLLVLAASCSRQPDNPAKTAENVTPPVHISELEMYDVSLNSDNIVQGQQVSFCFKALNAIMVTGFPGKFTKNGSPGGDCLVHTPEADTMYRIEVTGSDGTTRSQSAFVRVGKREQ